MENARKLNAIERELPTQFVGVTTPDFEWLHSTFAGHRKKCTELKELLIDMQAHNQMCSNNRAAG